MHFLPSLSRVDINIVLVRGRILVIILSLVFLHHFSGRFPPGGRGRGRGRGRRWGWGGLVAGFRDRQSVGIRATAHLEFGVSGTTCKKSKNVSKLTVFSHSEIWCRKTSCRTSGIFYKIFHNTQNWQVYFGHPEFLKAWNEEVPWNARDFNFHTNKTWRESSNLSLILTHSPSLPSHQTCSSS